MLGERSAHDGERVVRRQSVGLSADLLLGRDCFLGELDNDWGTGC